MTLEGLFGAATRLPTRVGRLPGALTRTVTEAARPRRVHGVAGRSRIAVRGVHLPGSESMVRALQRALFEVAGVSRVEVNAVLGYVMVTYGDDVPVDDLVTIV